VSVARAVEQAPESVAAPAAACARRLRARIGDRAIGTAHEEQGGKGRRRERMSGMASGVADQGRADQGSEFTSACQSVLILLRRVDFVWSTCNHLVENPISGISYRDESSFRFSADRSAYARASGVRAPAGALRCRRSFSFWVPSIATAYAYGDR
jgi:hypothetical protein